MSIQNQRTIFSTIITSIVVALLCYNTYFSDMFAENEVISEEKIPTSSETNEIEQKIQRKIVVIDPGHGGVDFGALGPYGLIEKDYVLDIALMVQEQFKDDSEIKILLSRNDNAFLSLSERTDFANSKGADLFISLHSNASPEKSASGLEVYYLDNNQDRASKLLADRENKYIGLNQNLDDLEFILSDLIQSNKQGESIVLAKYITNSIIAKLNEKFENIKSMGIKKAPFYVLVGAHMPCLLLELFFIDNQNDAKLMSQSNFKTYIAKGIYNGIKEYFKNKNAR